MGLATVLGIARRGFFIPYRYAGLIPPHAERGTYAAVAEAFRARADSFQGVLATVQEYQADLEALAGPAPGALAAPRWDQDWFPPLDAAVLYALIRRHRPARIFEVGCGHSTRFAARAVADEGLETEIRCFDPAPRAVLDGLGVVAEKVTVQEAGAETFEPLAAGDFLVVDSSHILMPGSDVDLLVNHVLPSLPAGVLVQFHDIFLPDDYPEAWDWRGYNEQLALVPLVLGGRFEIVFSSRFADAGGLPEGHVVRGFAGASAAPPSSLWLRSLGQV